MSANILPPFNAYDGRRLCLFISYSHNDCDVVFEENKRLHDLGCRCQTYRDWQSIRNAVGLK